MRAALKAQPEPDPSDLEHERRRQAAALQTSVSVAKCHTFCLFPSAGQILGIQVTDSKASKKVSHLSHLSPLSHFQVLRWFLVVDGMGEIGAYLLTTANCDGGFTAETERHREEWENI